MGVFSVSRSRNGANGSLLEIRTVISSTFSTLSSQPKRVSLKRKLYLGSMDTRFGWLDKVEKVDDMTVRISSKEPFAPFLDRLTANTPIYPAKIYRALENKSD